MEKRYLPSEVVELGLIPGSSINLLAQMRFRGDGPRFVKISPRKVAYSESAIEEWLRQREQTSTQENATA